MSVRCLAGAKEDFVQSGTFASFMRASQLRVKDFEFQTIPDGDHFFMLGKKDATLKILRSWVETPATKAVSKKRH
jgi:surfactin synthase thioesterase subunit